MTTMHDRRTRRLAAGITGVLTLALLTGCGAPGAPQAADQQQTLQPKKPTKPISISVLDAAGDLAGTKRVFESFKQEHPELVKDIGYQTANAPDVTGKLNAQKLGGDVKISLVLGGTGVVGPARQQNLLIKQYPTYQKDLPDLSKIFDDQRQQLQDLTGGYGLMNRWGPAGPLLSYDPKAVTDVPKTPAELLAWAKANPKKFTYAQPPNSGSGWTFLQDLPYLLGDKDPSDPVKGWDKTWAYLAELGKYTAPYPASSTIIGQQFGAGQITLRPQITGIDIVERQNGTIPADSAVATFDPQVWLTDGHFWMVPQGVDAETLYVDLALERYVMSDKEQAATLSAAAGQLTSANKNVTLDDATAAEKPGLQKWARLDFYPKAFTQGRTETVLTAANLAKALQIWTEKIGSSS